MPTALTLPSSNPLALAELEELVDGANELAQARHAPATRRAYLSDFASFEAWCAKQGLVALPATPATVAVYLTALTKTPRPDGGTRSVSSLERALAGIAHAHRSRGYEWPRAEPTISKVMAGIRRTLGVAPKRQKAPVDDAELAALVAATGEGLAGARDRAVLTLGWMGAFRRSELVALQVGDVERVRAGLRVLVRTSKTDQQSAGEHVGVPYASNPALCPVRALEDWLAASGITEGPIFRSIHRSGRMSTAALGDRSVALIVQRAAERAGLDPAKLAGHSLRAGFATTASIKGRSTGSIARQLRHKSESTTRKYVRPQTVFQDNAAVGLV